MNKFLRDFQSKIEGKILKGQYFGNLFFIQGDPLHVLAGGDICFAPPFGNGDEEVLSVSNSPSGTYLCVS